MEENKKKFVGKCLYFLKPEYALGDLTMIYRKVEGLRCNKKSLKVKNLERFGRVIYDDRILYETLQDFYESFSEALESCKKYLIEEIKLGKEFFTKHDIKDHVFQTQKDVLHIFEKYLEYLDAEIDEDNIANILESADRDIDNYLGERCKFNVEDSVKTKDGSGVVENRRIIVGSSPVFPKIHYGVRYESGSLRYAGYGEDQVQSI